MTQVTTTTGSMTIGIDLGDHWVNLQGRPTPIVVEGGRPIPELG